MYCAASKPKNGNPHSSPPSVKKVMTGSCSDSQQAARFPSGRRLLVVSLIVVLFLDVVSLCAAAPGQLFSANPVCLDEDSKKPVGPLHRRETSCLHRLVLLPQ